MTIDETVVSYLTTRLERSYAAVRQAIDLLDPRRCGWAGR